MEAGAIPILVVPALGRLRQEDQLSPGFRGQPGQHSKILSQKKKDYGNDAHCM
jgi:hypothetical protein